ncbi:type 2 isopentenyl-diphosphate Delta-isomerase [Mesobacillus subterraneus]|uniref:type 2 isopentenyl-diphosphate Delta-isomerase n=1 Tax=Mesobacillus subterraneus TaxID=285983 RepID=UPI001CFE4EF1|nr:type 2 isopentenyl-diphosphate Delta-isomerase [Mesobacillus subterraneus]WLR56532.1 type 2 isopentenyl-diphosphate Delta-isomerase [Mesobacillus subterraneus]
MSRSKRKWDHIQYALETGQKRQTGFDDIKFVNQSLPGSNLDSVKLNTQIGELSLSSPIFINAMTGGGGERTYRINRELAVAARETGSAIAVGSQMAALKDPDERRSYEVVREMHPDGIILANVGSEATVEQAKAAIHMIQADALQIHLNVVQELTMPEGDRNFDGALKRMIEIQQCVGVPVIVKEVGFGISAETAAKLFSSGIRYIDIGGFGGTNFAEIENKRRNRLLTFFEAWGIPTAASIMETKSASPELSVIASGGIQTSLDIVKAIALGADGAAMAGYLLKILMENRTEDLINEIHILKEEMAVIMTALGVHTIEELKNVPLVISGDTHHWLEQRGIDTKIYARRAKF